MRHTSSILIFLQLVFINAIGQQDSNSNVNTRSIETTISIHFKGRGQIAYNSAVELPRLRNPSLKDSIITNRIYLNKPTHIYYSDIIMDPAGQKLETGNLIIFPGDSITLENGGRKLTASIYSSRFVDSLLYITPSEFPGNPKAVSAQDKRPDLRDRLAGITDNYLANENRIANLSIDSSLKTVLHSLNTAIMGEQVTEISVQALSDSDRSTLDSVYKALQHKLSELEKISSPICNSVYDAIIRYSASLNGQKSSRFWSYFDKADSTITSMSFYQPYLLESLERTYKRLPDELEHLLTEKRGRPSSAVDTVMYIAGILHQTKTNYQSAKAQLDAYADGRFAYLLSEKDVLHRQQRTLNMSASFRLLGADNKPGSLQSLIQNTGKNIVLIDFWASWCVPCIAEFPSLKKVQSDLKDQSIEFVGISIDIDKDKAAWMKLIKKYHSSDQSKQFRLVDAKHSPVNNFFNLNTIPRYIVIDKRGKILEEDFMRPSDPAFTRRLEEHLRQFHY